MNKNYWFRCIFQLSYGFSIFISNIPLGWILNSQSIDRRGFELLPIEWIIVEAKTCWPIQIQTQSTIDSWAFSILFHFSTTQTLSTLPNSSFTKCLSAGLPFEWSHSNEAADKTCTFEQSKHLPFYCFFRLNSNCIIKIDNFTSISQTFVYDIWLKS